MRHSAEGNVCIFATNCVVICNIYGTTYSKMHIFYVVFSYDLPGVMKVIITGTIFI